MTYSNNSMIPGNYFYDGDKNNDSLNDAHLNHLKKLQYN